MWGARRPHGQFVEVDHGGSDNAGPRCGFESLCFKAAQMNSKAPTDRDIRAVVDVLATRYGAQKVFLFGSAAQGASGSDSDVDLVVVKETTLSFFDRLKEVGQVCRWHRGFDVLVYTPSEFEEMSRSCAFIREEVLRKGRLLYERAA